MIVFWAWPSPPAEPGFPSTFSEHLSVLVGVALVAVPSFVQLAGGVAPKQSTVGPCGSSGDTVSAQSTALVTLVLLFWVELENRQFSIGTAVPEVAENVVAPVPVTFLQLAVSFAAPLDLNPGKLSRSVVEDGAENT